MKPLIYVAGASRNASLLIFFAVIGLTICETVVDTGLVARG